MTIIDRLSKLDGLDMEYDREIHAHFGLPFNEVLCDKPFVYNAYTASVDAAIALAARVLPGCDLTIRSKHKMAWIDGLKGEIAYGANPAIAACIAILRAKECIEWSVKSRRYVKK